MPAATIASPIGHLLLEGDGETLSALQMVGVQSPAPAPRGTAFAAACEQLEQYFAGERSQFEIPLAPRGTGFEQRVWDALRTIPYGMTESYGALARRIGAPDAARAVGLANGRNPIAIIIPCHRVIGADGSLTGFGGGLPRKRFLLDHEAGVAPLLSPG